ncbi:MAG: DUF167 domain-containing protein [Acidimicrobiia bacterium]
MITTVDGGVILDIRVQPGAGRTAVVGRHGDELKLRVGAPPVEGRANEAVLAFLADAFDLRKAAVTLVSGPTSRSKRIRLDGVDEATATTVVDRLIDSAKKR